MKKITSEISAHPDIALEEIVNEFELGISISALSRKLTKENLTFKKRRFSRKTDSVKTLPGCGQNGSRILGI